MVKWPKQFVYKLVVPAPDWNCIWSWLQIRQFGAANLELSGSSFAINASLSPSLNSRAELVLSPRANARNDAPRRWLVEYLRIRSDSFSQW